MAFTVNGIGTSMCPGRGLISWASGSWWSRNGTHDYDGCMCFCVLLLPIVPLKSVHVFGRVVQGTGEHFQLIPIRWSLALILRAFAARWIWVLVFAGAALSLIGLTDAGPSSESLLGCAWGALLLTIAGVVYCLLLMTDVRTVDIRRVMMATPFGSSDPATWTPAILKSVYSPRKIFVADSFQAAARQALIAGEFGKAMLAARYAATLEDARAGEDLTDEILRHPHVAAALPRVHRDPNLWREMFGKGLELADAPPDAISECETG